MHRAILEACGPCFLALAAAFAALVLTVRLSGARWDWRRLRELHACQDGGVQSLAFVLTLPIFITIVLFIVQVSQLMVGTVAVHYSAFAAARSAIVWIPAQVGFSERQNRLNLGGLPARHGDQYLIGPLSELEEGSAKLHRVRMAAVMGCAPVCPSRDLGIAPTGEMQSLAETASQLYHEMIPTAAGNTRIRQRILNKVAFSDRNTEVYVAWREGRDDRGRNPDVGPTYNPRNHPYRNADWDRYGWKPNEIGWQDPVTVHVVHHFALLPGPGRFLAQRLVRADGLPDRVADRIEVNRGGYSETVYTVAVPASATMTNEGIKSGRPYVHDVR